MESIHYMPQFVTHTQHTKPSQADRPFPGKHQCKAHTKGCTCSAALSAPRLYLKGSALYSKR